MTPLERYFLTLSRDFALGAADLSRVFELPKRVAARILRRAKAKDARACDRLLEDVFAASVEGGSR